MRLRHPTRRAARLLAGAAIGLALVTATAGGPSPAGALPAAAPAPAGPACSERDGIVVTAEMVEAVAASDGHAVTPAGASVSGGCGRQQDEEDLGWTGEATDTPDDAASDEDDADPFAPPGGGQRWYSYQFGLGAEGLPDYWEQPVALSTPAWSGTVDTIGYTWLDAGTGEQIGGRLPVGGACAYRGPVPAAAAPRRVADYRRHGHPRIYWYDHVPLRAPAGWFRNAGGGWYHYMCGPVTPAGIAGPGGTLSPLEADYYNTPHWVYAKGWSAAQVTVLSRVIRVARSRLQVADVVRTSPAARSVVGLAVWMWAPPAGYQLRVGGLRARIEPTGIVVRAPGVPLTVHDLRDGGCRGGGQPDVGDQAGTTDCSFVFHRATGRDPAAAYPVGLALRWTVTTTTAGGAALGPPMTFWTTSVRRFQVGEVQVPVR
jgi:hypothetical protein